MDLGGSDNEAKKVKSKKGRKRGAETWIQERQGEIVDLLDPRTAKVVTGMSSVHSHALFDTLSAYPL